MEKLIRIKVNTPKGERTLTFRPTCAPKDHYVCEICPYSKTCERIPDPRDPENKDRTFIDFCGDIERGNLADQKDEITEKPTIKSEMMPVEGTIENNLGDIFDINQELIKKNSYVHLQDVIKSVCAGWCDSFDPTYCNCTSSNASCLLCGLFKNSQIEFPPEPEKEEGEETDE